MFVNTRALVVTHSHDGVELERATAVDGESAVKVALLMLAKLDALRPGDVLRVDADDSALAHGRASGGCREF